MDSGSSVQEMGSRRDNETHVNQVASTCANLFYKKFCPAASYAASYYVYQPASVANLELNTPQSLLLALIHSSVIEDVSTCILLFELCCKCQQLCSRYLKVWLTEDFNFPPNDMKKGLLFLSELSRKGSVQLPRHLSSILSFLAHRYKAPALYFHSSDEGEDVSLEKKLKIAVLHNSPVEILSLGMQYLLLNKKKSKLLGSLLHTAISSNSIECTTALICLKADLEVRNLQGMTPLHHAVIKNSPGIANILLEAGANVNRRYLKGDTLLHLAAAGGYNEVLQVLVENGFNDVDSKNYLGETSLFQAIKANNIGAVRILLRKGANPYIQTNDNDTPFERALQSPNVVLIKAFAKGVSSDLITGSGDSILHYVVRLGNKDVLQILLDSKPSLKVKNKEGYLPLHVARDPCILEMLIRSGSNIDSLTGNGKTLLHLATAEGAIDLVMALIYLGAALDLKDSKGNTAICIAAEKSKHDILKLLLQEGARPDIKTDAGWNAIHYAAKVGSLECTRALLEAGVDVDTKSNNSSTPAMFAALNNRVEVIKLLREYGAKLVTKNDSGNGLLHWAAEGGAVDVVSCLLDYGLDINERDNNGYTPIMVGAFYNKLEAIKRLKRRGADCEARCNNGCGPLHWAASGGAIDVVNWFLDNGVNMNETNNNGSTPLAIATRKNQTEIVNILKQRGGV